MDTADSPHSAGAPPLICSPATRGPERRNHYAPPGASHTNARPGGTPIIRDVYTILYTGCVCRESHATLRGQGSAVLRCLWLSRVMQEREVSEGRPARRALAHSPQYCHL